MSQRVKYEEQGLFSFFPQPPPSLGPGPISPPRSGGGGGGGGGWGVGIDGGLIPGVLEMVDGLGSYRTRIGCFQDR